MYVKYGLEDHLKGLDDSYFGECDRRLAEAELREAIITTGDVVRILSDSAGNAKKEVFMEFLPDVERAEWVSQHRILLPASLPAPIRSSHCYSFRIADKRRLQPGKSLPGKDGNTIAGVESRSHYVPHMQADAGHKCKGVLAAIVVESSDSEAEDKDDGVKEVGDAAAPDDASRFHLGWKISFRTSTPEQPNREKTLAKLRKKADNFAGALAKTPWAGRHMESQRTPDAENRMKERRKQQAAVDAAERAAFKASLLSK